MEATETTVRTASSPIPQIFPTQDKAIARLAAFRIEISSSTANAHSFVPDVAESKVALGAGWIGEIQRIWAKGAANTLELARTVFRARRSMGYGSWAQMWRSKQLPFAISKAKMLVRIGEHLGELDGQTFGRLPSGWSILYILSLLGATSVQRLVEEGIIHPRLTLWEARELLAKHKGQPGRLHGHQVRLRLKRFARFVRDTVSGWELEERAFATETLTQLIEQIAVAESGVLKRDPNSSTVITRLGLLIDPRIKL